MSDPTVPIAKMLVEAKGSDTGKAKFSGASLFFDGSGHYLTIPDDVTFDFGGGDFSIVCWINTDGEVQFSEQS